MVLSVYELAWRPAAALIRGTDAQVAHERTLRLMRRADGVAGLDALARLANRLVFPRRPTRVGGVQLPHPIILAAGLVKGDGFREEAQAMTALHRHRNVVPGWRSLPALLGAVEFGSFTRRPRLGNRGRVLWRDDANGSMQNRIGLRNPGVRAAAAHLRSNARLLPPVWGLNLALSPGVEDLDQGTAEIREAAAYVRDAFGDVGGGPAWYTLNLSCPNTEDDPHGRQTDEQARRYASALVEVADAPVWVKIGPDLGDEQIGLLARAFADAGVRAVVATNTLPAAAPGGGPQAGMSGARLRPLALRTVTRLDAAIREIAAPLDIVACGGIMNGADLLAFQAAGARAAMVYSALVFRGPLAGALILREADREARRG